MTAGWPPRPLSQSTPPIAALCVELCLLRARLRGCDVMRRGRATEDGARADRELRPFAAVPSCWAAHVVNQSRSGGGLAGVVGVVVGVVAGVVVGTAGGGGGAGGVYTRSLSPARPSSPRIPIARTRYG